MSLFEELKNSVSENWYIVRSGYSPEDESNLETVFTLANGYMGIRGSLELPSRGKECGTYAAGVFDKIEVQQEYDAAASKMRNKAITPAYAIMPDMLMIEILVAGENFDFMNCRVDDVTRTLDMLHGIVFNSYALTSPSGKSLKVCTSTLVSKVRKHIALQKVSIIPLNFDAPAVIKFKNTLHIGPQHIARLNDYISQTNLLHTVCDGANTYLEGQVEETGTGIIACTETAGVGDKSFELLSNGICETFRLDLQSGAKYSFEKTVCLYTSRDGEDYISLCKAEIKNAMQSGHDALIAEHIKWWQESWKTSDIELVGIDFDLQTGIRWNLFHLIQTASEDDPDLSISATGLHGQGYFGHAFWDTEIFMIPFFLATNVQVAKNLLLYRYNRLDVARELAKKAGCKGAKFPWTSAYTGEDVTPPDWERCANRQIHISGDIAYAFRNYYNQTGDKDFYANYAVELIVETAKFYSSKVKKGEDGKFHILDVIGPDEYNLHANDNYYTNFLAAWNMREAIAGMELLRKEYPKQYNKVCLATEWTKETEEWLRDIEQHMAYPRTVDNVNEQYEGFFDLQYEGDIPRDQYNMPIGIKHQYTGNQQLLKQADTVMMHFLFPDQFTKEQRKASFEFYEKRCLHGSSLSPSIHCVTGLRTGFIEHAYGYLYLTALMDLNNLHMDKNLADGLHAACAGGTWAAVVYGFGGVEFQNGDIHINPILPKEWEGLKFSVAHKGSRLKIYVSRDSFTVESNKNTEIFVNDTSCMLENGKASCFPVDYSRYLQS